jgi:hypothetical protein
MKNKIISFNFILLFLLSLLSFNVLSQVNDDYDYGLDSNYNSPDSDFYYKSDPSKWDYSKVKWDLVDYSRIELYSVSDIYSIPDFYDNLPEKYYSRLNYNEVDYSMIKDHQRINSDKYFKDLNCRECSLSNFYNLDITYSKEGITHYNGNHVSIPGNYPKGSLFEVEENRIIVRIGYDEEIDEIIMIPSDIDIVTLSSSNNIILSDGTIISGYVSFDEGNMRVNHGDTVIINNIMISFLDGETNNYIDIYTDGRICSPNCISFDEDRKLFLDFDNHIKLDFWQDNLFFDVEINDNLVMDFSKSQFLIVNRRDEGLIPEITGTKKDKDSIISIYNGNFWLYNEEDKLRVKDDDIIKNYNTVPMSLILFNEDGKSIIGSTTNEFKKLVISNYNEIASIPRFDTDGTSEIFLSYDYSPSLVSERLSFNNKVFTKEDFQKKFPDISLKGNDEEVTSEAIKRLIDTINHLPSELTDKLSGREIHLKPNSDFVDMYGSENKVGGYVTKEDGSMHLRSNYLVNSIVYHELAHVYFQDYEQTQGITNLRKERSSLWNSLVDNDDEIKSIKEQKSIFDDFLTQEELDFQLKFRIEEIRNLPENKEMIDKINSLDKKIFEESLKHPMKQEWLSVVGGIEAYKGKTSLTNEGEVIWSNSKCIDCPEATQARDGFVRSYGASDIEEDIATYLENIYRNPKFYDPLIFPEDYSIEEINKFNNEDPSKFRKKIELLYKYNFITQERYNLIMKIK